MFERVERGFGAVGDVDLVEDVGQVACDGAVADVELFADVPVGVSLGRQGEHFALAVGEPVGRFRPGVADASSLGVLTHTGTAEWTASTTASGCCRGIR